MINNELTLTVNDNKIIACRRGDNLFKVLCSAGYVFSGNCGGLGRCQRCLVDVKGAGTVKSCTYTITDNIQITIGEDNMSVLASYKGADEFNNVYNGDGRGIGIAIDLGTTTIAIEQIDMSDGSVTDRCGFMNPQIEYGSDVISRIRTGSTEDGLTKLRSSVVTRISSELAGILAGSGLLSSGTYAGIAPFCNLIIGKVLDQNGNGSIKNVINGIQWIRDIYTQFHIRIINISVGTRPDLSIHQKLLLLNAVESLWDLGLVVVVSAGNYGPAPGSVTVPGSSPKVITVGVPDTFPLIHTQRHPLNYSGRGPTDDCIVKPDVFAPGTGIVSCNAFYSQFPNAPPYLSKTGTSMAAPVVSGAIACLLSKYPFLTNAEVKLKLHASCVQIPGTESGWGILDFSRLLE